MPLTFNQGFTTDAQIFGRRLPVASQFYPKNTEARPPVPYTKLFGGRLAYNLREKKKGAGITAKNLVFESMKAFLLLIAVFLTFHFKAQNNLLMATILDGNGIPAKEVT